MIIRVSDGIAIDPRRLTFYRKAHRSCKDNPSKDLKSSCVMGLTRRDSPSLIPNHLKIVGLYYLGRDTHGHTKGIPSFFKTHNPSKGAG